jgi:hypothetical protein
MSKRDCAHRPEECRAVAKAASVDSERWDSAVLPLAVAGYAATMIVGVAATCVALAIF